MIKTTVPRYIQGANSTANALFLSKIMNLDPAWDKTKLHPKILVLMPYMFDIGKNNAKKIFVFIQFDSEPHVFWPRWVGCAGRMDNAREA